MVAQDFYNLKVRKAKGFGFPEPIFINAEKLSNRSRVIYLVEIQSILVPDKQQNKTHHYALKFSKFKKIKEEPFWIEEEIATEKGFSITNKASLKKLLTYIKANEELLNIDILSKEHTSAILLNDKMAIDLVKKI
jgi:hypothetical protein